MTGPTGFACSATLAHAAFTWQMATKLKRIVIKVGTSTLANKDGRIDREYIASLTAQIAAVRSRGFDVVLVTSGAIRAGMERMALKERPKTMPENQAAAAIGQGLLMHTYTELFACHGITTGQVLVTSEDFGHRKRYLNARNTVLTLFRHGAVPIVNENDTVAVEEIRVGDNDNLSAVVASSLEADLLIILSDVPGLCDAGPGESGYGRVIPVVDKITPAVRAIAGEARSEDGTGGMRTKLEAAEIAMNSGVTMVIADGRRPDVIPDVVSGAHIGTRFVPRKERLRSRKRWIAFGAPARGSVTVNEGAKKMVRDGGKSLLAAGIVGVTGSFSSGDLVKVLDEEGNQFARGLVNYSVNEIGRIKGKHSSEIESVLGYKDYDEVIHRDNLVLGV